MITLYKDNLIEITDQEIVFFRYYFPFCNKRRVPLRHIKSVEVRKPSLLGGSLRLWGTGDLRTYFPLDWNRSGRDRIFITLLNKSSSWWNSRRIGFTVDDSQKVIDVLGDIGLLSEAPRA